MNRLLGPVLLVVFWILLQGDLTVANLVGGLIVVGLVAAIDRRLRSPREHRFHLVGVVLLTADLVWRLITSSVVVAWTVIRPTDERLASGVVSVPLRTDSELVATVVADLITLTPGTLTLDARMDPAEGGPVLLVHVLGLGDAQDVRDEVAVLEDKVLRAIEPRGGPTGATVAEGTA